MKKFILVFFSLFVFTFVIAQEEYIRNFDVVIRVASSGTLFVKEKIDIKVANIEIYRGIFRTLPTTRNDVSGNEVTVEYVIHSVKKNGVLENYTTSKKGNSFEIKIGNKNNMLSPDFYTYEIEYSTFGHIGFFKDYDEIFWNVNGTYWDFPFKKITAKVLLPPTVKPLKTVCFTGEFGRTESNCQVVNLADNSIYFEALDLAARENVSVVVSFPKGFIKEPPLPLPPTFFETYSIALLAALLFLITSIYYIFTWSAYGVDPVKPIAIPQFKVPENLSPASVGMIVKEKYWSDLVSASIVNLAIKGFVKIKDESTTSFFGIFKNKVFKLVELKKERLSLPEEEQVLLKYLFESNDILHIDGTYNSTIKKTIDAYKKKLDFQHKKLINEGNNYKFLIIPILLLVVFLLGIVILDIEFIPTGLLNFLGGGVSFLPFFVFSLILTRRLNMTKSLLYGGFGLVLIAFLSIAFYFFAVRNSGIMSLNFLVIAGFITFLIFSLFFYSYFIKKPSQEKLRLQSLIDGFKMYLSAAEEKMIQNFNSPNLTPEVFENYLPYAIALGVAEVWGEKFQNILKTASLEDTYKSNWYSGPMSSQIDFGHTLNSSLSNTISSSSVKPSQSGGGGSWSSGSSGGGSSGGGGGGGGGW